MGTEKKLKALKVFFLILLFNFLGVYVTNLLLGNEKVLYNSLEKPWFSLPINLFPLIWSVLYLLLAIAVVLNYKKSGQHILIYILFMLINFYWSYIFFVQNLYGIGFFIIIILIISFLYLCIKYFKSSKLASFIVCIYLVYLVYVGLLNYFIWMYNEM